MKRTLWFTEATLRVYNEVKGDLETIEHKEITRNPIKGRNFHLPTTLNILDVDNKQEKLKVFHISDYGFYTHATTTKPKCDFISKKVYEVHVTWEDLECILDGIPKSTLDIVYVDTINLSEITKILEYKFGLTVGMCAIEGYKPVTLYMPCNQLLSYLK